MSGIIIRNVSLVNEGVIKLCDILIDGAFIRKISPPNTLNTDGLKVIDGTDKHLFPGMIDDQVHFREPGLTHKATIYSESKAAVAGGITSFMEMPNTVPNTLTQELLEDKYNRAAETSIANYSFFMGAGNDNLKEVLKTNKSNVCGVKVFMGSSTGNMLVDNKDTLNALFSECELLIATHCEDETTIKTNLAHYIAQYGEEIPVHLHPIIRSAEACYKSSSMAVELASKHNTKLHILHISTTKETELFSTQPLRDKRITAEACIHHMWFTDKDYATKGNFIKWNPAVKQASDREAIIKAVNEGRIDVIATDHAPHTIDEKSQSYTKAPSGGPLVQHALIALLDLVKKGDFTLEQVVKKTAHNVADLFQVHKRGYVREGYYADLVLIDLNKATTVSKNNIYYQCKWSPFEGHQFSSSVETTLVNGNIVYENGNFNETSKGMRLIFDR
jgi:dihydroorotase